MLAIYKRELASYFKSMIGYVFMFIMFVVIGIYFFAYCLSYGYPSVSYVLYGMSYVLMIVVPILTMSVIAEERKQKTDQLLLTSPVSIGKIVGGKFLALVSVFAVPMLILCLFPLFLRSFGKIPWALNYVGILGFFLLGITFIAVGIFVSSLVDNPIVSAVITVVALFLIFRLGDIQSMLPTSINTGVVEKILNACNITNRFLQFEQGSLDLTAIFYFISIAFIFLFLTTQVMNKRRYR